MFGCDFSSRPGPRKPIVVACGALQDDVVVLGRLASFATLEALGHWLQSQPRWLGGFDFPFGLPRELVLALGWPAEWLACMRHYGTLSRAEIRHRFAAYCDSREPGHKFAHRATDRWAGSSPSMKWVNPPVAYMLHAGVPLLIAAQAQLPGMYDGAGRVCAAVRGNGRVALEAYPGLLAREVLGHASYKSDERARQNEERRQQRIRLVEALTHGATRLALRLQLSAAQRTCLVEDARGDQLDAVLCLLQAAWGQRCGAPGFGLPLPIDPLEGWIVTALPESSPA